MQFACPLHAINTFGSPAMNLSAFIAHAVKLEREAAAIYRKSSEMIDPIKNRDEVAFFQEMAGYAQQHLQEVMKRAGVSEDFLLPAEGYLWGRAPSPEAITPLPTATDLLDLDGAMALALDAECRAVDFYAGVVKTATEAEVLQLAECFVAEERQHVLALERFMGLKPY
jgi:rubrerythrin